MRKYFQKHRAHYRAPEASTEVGRPSVFPTRSSRPAIAPAYVAAVSSSGWEVTSLAGTSATGIAAEPSVPTATPATGEEARCYRCGSSTAFLIPVLGEPSQMVCAGCIPYRYDFPEVLVGSDHQLLPGAQSMGVEVECLIRAWDPRLVYITRPRGDGSLRGTTPGCIPIELPTVPASGTSLVSVIDDLTVSLEAVRASVNVSCGLHVHAGMAGTTRTQRTNLRSWWRIYEPIFFSCVSDWRRRSSFAHQISATSEAQWQDLRYSALNIQSLSRHNTYEVRLPEGSVDKEYILFWLSLLANFFYNHRDLVPDTSILEFLATATDREILGKFIKNSALPGQTTRQLLAALSIFAPGSSFRTKRPRTIQEATDV